MPDFKAGLCSGEWSQAVGLLTFADGALGFRRSGRPFRQFELDSLPDRAAFGTDAPAVAEEARLVGEPVGAEARHSSDPAGASVMPWMSAVAAKGARSHTSAMVLPALRH